MQIHASLPSNLWDELYVIASYLNNLTTTKSLSSKTPYKKWFKKKPNLSHLREIGCHAFVLIQNQHNPKIYECSIECILVGVASTDTTTQNSCLEHAIEESQQSAIHVKAIQDEQRRALAELRAAVPPHDPEIADGATQRELQETLADSLGPENAQYLDDLFATLGHSAYSAIQLEDEPNSWEEAQASADAQHWLKGYQDELKSLKEMGIYKLVPRSAVPQDHKI
ncbi:hypothetical protein IW261DRAFT_1573432 [Armillaria novae-zelandiae]|uniref:Uncharacterized protein n=1 Tax=Armillaria novae-zelandiae TaxID=153914 RepID=A0AA39NNB4_9AGAR|nr:hypothetical protein IW261DRAFT_1573432 [Armillaria novae-zelandiae]